MQERNLKNGAVSKLDSLDGSFFLFPLGRLSSVHHSFMLKVKESAPCTSSGFTVITVCEAANFLIAQELQVGRKVKMCFVKS